MDMDERKAELLRLCESMDEVGKACAGQLIDEMVFLEVRLTELRKQPFLSICPTNAAKQRQTPAAKQYKELLQQYTNIVKIMHKMLGGSETEEESPLRGFMKRFNGSDAE